MGLFISSVEELNINLIQVVKQNFGTLPFSESPFLRMGEVETYTSLAPVGALTQEYKGLLVVSKVKSRNVFSDIGSGLKSMVGGEIKGLSKLTSDVREELLVETKQKAAEVGANAVVGIRMETNTIFDGCLDLVIYGTAIRFTR